MESTERAGERTIVSDRRKGVSPFSSALALLSVDGRQTTPSTMATVVCAGERQERGDVVRMIISRRCLLLQLLCRGCFSFDSSSSSRRRPGGGGDELQRGAGNTPRRVKGKSALVHLSSAGWLGPEATRPSMKVQPAVLVDLCDIWWLSATYMSRWNRQLQRDERPHRSTDGKHFLKGTATRRDVLRTPLAMEFVSCRLEFLMVLLRASEVESEPPC